jgi:hypothetical protein
MSGDWKDDFFFFFVGIKWFKGANFTEFYVRGEWVNIMLNDRSFMGIEKLGKFVGTDMIHRYHFQKYV